MNGNFQQEHQPSYTWYSLDLEETLIIPTRLAHKTFSLPLISIAAYPKLAFFAE
jgi:hypothetical protein